MGENGTGRSQKSNPKKEHGKSTYNYRNGIKRDEEADQNETSATFFK